MSKHQIIYTSCKRGINGINDGQQVYSYDVSFGDSVSDKVKSLFTYQIPTLAAGVIMTEELAEKMPQSFIYRRLTDNSCAIALNTYLGRDYMGSTGRFGNHLSHAVICENSEFTSYPCEFYGSELLRERMSFEEVNSPDRPQFLSEPILLKGYRIDITKVIEFLMSQNRMDAYKKMLASMLAYESARKRVVICDSPENIVKWIAALHYALPLKMALNVDFTTYEYDPSLSISQICGVIPDGTRYTAANASTHFTFDFLQDIIPNIDVEGEFFDFIDTGMSLSYDSIQDFHEFVCNKLTYMNANEKLYSAYSLYCLFNDGLDNLSLTAFRNAVQMSNEFGADAEKLELVKKLLSERAFILSTTDGYTIEIFKAILIDIGKMSFASQEYAKVLVTEKVLAAFVSASANENTFIGFYSEIEALCNISKISIPYELMKDNNREKLLSAMKSSPEQWKWSFIIDIICEFAAVQQISADELSMDYPIGKLFSDLILTRISDNMNDGFALVTQIIAKFSKEWNRLANIALDMESILFNLPDPSRIINMLWKYVYQIIAKTQSENRHNIYMAFLSYNRFEQVLEIYNELLTIADNMKTAKELFQEQLEIQSEKYLQSYSTKICEYYYEFLSTSKEDATQNAKKELLKLVVKSNFKPGFICELIDAVLSTIPLSAPNRENEELISLLLDYYNNKNDLSNSNRLVLIVSGTLLSKSCSSADLDKSVRIAKDIIKDDCVDITYLSATEADKYVAWIAKPIFANSKSAKALISNYSFFRHTRGTSSNFIAVCAKEAMKESKGDKEYASILMFLEFLFNVGNADECKGMGRVLCKLNKQKLESLDAAVQAEFQGNRLYISRWDDIRDIAASTNPLLNNIGKLFKRKKD